MVEIKTTDTSLNLTTDVDSIKGNKVISKNGEEIGKVSSLYLNPDNFKLEAIKVNKGMFKDDHFISKEYIDNISEEGIILNITPLEEFRDKMVLDAKGKEIGKVSEINKVGPTNELLSLVIKRDSEDLVVPEHEIKEMGESIILNREVMED